MAKRPNTYGGRAAAAAVTTSTSTFLRHLLSHPDCIYSCMANHEALEGIAVPDLYKQQLKEMKQDWSSLEGGGQRFRMATSLSAAILEEQTSHISVLPQKVHDELVALYEIMPDRMPDLPHDCILGDGHNDNE